MVQELAPIFGNGKDGDKIVTATESVNFYTAGDGASGQKEFSVDSPELFASGDLVMLWQGRGGIFGDFEIQRVAGVGANSIEVGSPLANAYSRSGDDKSQAIWIPEYQGLTISAGGVLTCDAWDGTIGGILVAAVRGNTIATGDISVNDKGYRGGANSGQNAGGQGEGFNLRGEEVGNPGDQTSNDNGGGGGAGNVVSWGGGGGSYATQGTDGVGDNPGLKGDLVSTDDIPTTLTRIIPGAGGGGGGSNGGLGSPGGAGGGVIYLLSGGITVAGSMTSNGKDAIDPSAPQGAGGGGGAGGSILLKTKNGVLGTNKVTATGGDGATGAFDNGGNGGDGRIRVEACALTGSTDPAVSSVEGGHSWCKGNVVSFL